MANFAPKNMLALAALSLTLSACANAASQAVSNSNQVAGWSSMSGAKSSSSRMHSGVDLPGPVSPLVYVSEYLSYDVAVFDRDSGTRIGQIDVPAEPYGVVVDRRHNVWITSGWVSTFGSVFEYARGGAAPIRTLTDESGDPYDVTLCPDGTVYVTDGGNRHAGIAVYARGSDQPTGRLTYLGFRTSYWFVTCDAHGNVFATIARDDAGQVIGFPGGKQHLVYNLGIKVHGPGGIKVDNAGNLLVANEKDGLVSEYTEGGVPTGNVVHMDGVLGLGVSEDGKFIGGGRGGFNVFSRVYSFPGGALRRRYGQVAYPGSFAFDPGQSWTGQ